ncbi:MAG: T9SS type A sorting domain-containing protein [Candidatus Aegiribacteria sp.]|nr:T9SS type A sorting domain-containing protein [Candidatus Aegiribacteria sp.]
MRHFSILIAILVIVSISFATSVTQTNWSGGPGYVGPFNSWDAGYFYQSSNIEWMQTPGILQIKRVYDYEHIIAANFYGASSIIAADVNGDGKMDVLGAAAISDNIKWWENMDGTGGIWVQHPVNDNFDSASSVYAADIDNDGDMDVLGAAGLDHDIKWWENATGSGLGWIEHPVDLSFYGANSVYAADVDGDGDLDILGAASNVDMISWWENMDGTGDIWVEHKVDDNFDSASSVYAADIDNDGDMDVLGAAGLANDIKWWENLDGSGTSWTGHVVDQEFDGASSVFAADVDGDGKMDILGAAIYDDMIAWWKNMDGSGTIWYERCLDNNFDGASSVYSVDMDDDGDMDILGTARVANDVAWWENLNGSGTSWTIHEIDQNFEGASSVYTADFNNDGVLDVLGSAFVADYVSWWGGFEATGILESSILNTNAIPLWGSIDWTCSTGPGTSVAFQVRASADCNNMGEWSAVIDSPGSLVGILYNGHQYVQYRAILIAEDNNFTPTLEDITISWNLVGIDEDDPTEYSLLPFSPNPMQKSNVLIGYTVPGEAIVQLSIYDVSGRLVNQIESVDSQGGYYQVVIDELDSGLYFCQMRSGDFTETRQFVVIQ